MDTGTSPLHLLCFTNGGYSTYLRVMLQSLVETNPPAVLKRLTVHVGILDFEEELKPPAEAILAETGAALIWHEVGHLLKFEKAAIQSRVLPAYGRIVIDQFLPDEIEKILYVDVDLIFESALLDVYSTQDQGSLLLAAPDFLFHDLGQALYKSSSERRSSLKHQPYFNTGVLLIDMALWRNAGLSSRLREIVETDPETLCVNDQNPLNMVVPDWGVLDIAWNDPFGEVDFGPVVNALCRRERDLLKPKISHFYRHKPWSDDTFVPFLNPQQTRLFRQYLRKVGGAAPEAKKGFRSWYAARTAAWEKVHLILQMPKCAENKKAAARKLLLTASFLNFYSFPFFVYAKIQRTVARRFGSLLRKFRKN